MFFTFLCLAVPTVMVAYKIIDHFYPGNLKTYGLKASWYVLDLTSRFEIYSENKFKVLKCIIYKEVPASETARIKLIKESTEFGNYELNQFFETKDNINEPCDFAIYEIPVSDKKYDNYCIRYEDYKDIVEIKYNNVCSFNFLNMVRFQFKDSTREIYNLDFGRNQYIIAGNILFDRKFLKWYLKTNNNIILNDDDKYTISFIDHNMIYNTIDENFYIEIKKNTYEIMKLAPADSPATENNI